MKKQFIIHSCWQGLFGRWVPVFLILLAAATTQAQGSLFCLVAKDQGGNEPIENHPGSASTAEVRYIGSPDGDPLFNVLYTNSTGARFSVKVLDNEGHQLFQGVYTDRKFDRKFKVADAQNYSKLTFVIRNFQDNSVQHFEINSNARLVEDVEVKEVK